MPTVRFAQKQKSISLKVGSCFRKCFHHKNICCREPDLLHSPGSHRLFVRLSRHCYLRNKTFQFQGALKGSVLPHKAVAKFQRKLDLLNRTGCRRPRRWQGDRSLERRCLTTSSWQTRVQPSYLFICPVHLPDQSTYSYQW